MLVRLFRFKIILNFKIKKREVVYNEQHFRLTNCLLLLCKFNARVCQKLLSNKNYSAICGYRDFFPGTILRSLRGENIHMCSLQNNIKINVTTSNNYSGK